MPQAAKRLTDGERRERDLSRRLAKATAQAQAGEIALASHSSLTRKVAAQRVELSRLGALLSRAAVTVTDPDLMRQINEALNRREP
jgi:hypothetical protein